MTTCVIYDRRSRGDTTPPRFGVPRGNTPRANRITETTPDSSNASNSDTPSPKLLSQDLSRMLAEQRRSTMHCRDSR